MTRGVLAGALLGAALIGTAVAQNPAATINVDAAASRKAINPNVYGVAYGEANLPDLNVPLNRYGGNNTSRYNWQINADNRGFDWYFESIAESSAAPGGRGDAFIQQTKAAGAEPMVTIPIIDWIARLGPNRGKLASFSQAKYGAQTGNDWQWFPDAGNGVLQSTGKDITGNNPNDASTPNSIAIEQAWVQHIVGAFGTAANGGLKYYVLDNEHSIWHSTHRDVHPSGASMDEIKQKMVDYAAAIRLVDASAKIVGPEEWGWSAYIFSGKDQQYGSLNGWSGPFPDRSTHSNMDYMPWLLQALKQYDTLNGTKSLDVFTVHYYPQGGEFGNDTSSAMQLRRNRSTRSLWDPNYTDETWIADKVKLIPRMKGWVSTYYPGLETGITEYNWGAESHINGATTQADVLGIFGREGLDMGARWTTPDPSTPTYKAIKMYRNYDGQKSTFGDVSVAAGGPNPDNVAVFGAQRSSDGALTVMVISKYLSGSTPVTVNLANFAAGGAAKVWQLTSANTIAHPADVSLSGSSFSTSVPSPSVTLFVIPAGGTPNTPPTAVAAATPTSGIVPLAVAFSAAGSSDPDGTIGSYAWTFGDGGSATGVSVSHTYTTTGTFSAQLTVTDNLGATGTATASITVTADPNVLNAPSGLNASYSNKTKVVTLTWADNSSNETGFEIERAVNGSGSYTKVGTVAANVKTFTNNPGSGQWTYRVRAVSSTTGRFSAYSNTASVRVR